MVVKLQPGVVDKTPFTSSFDKVVRKALTRFHAPSVSLAVVDGSETWSKAYGLAQIEDEKPASPSTLYYVGSTTKAQLCAAWAIYINSNDNKDEHGAKIIDFSTPLADIIRDDFVLQDPSMTKMITLEDAFSHRTGQHARDASYGREGVRTQEALVRNLRNVPATSRLRTQFEYCNTMYVAASHALEVVTGRPLGDILREWLWKPLGMNNTYAGYSEAMEAVKEGSTLAYGYTWSKIFSDSDHEDGEQQCDGHMDFPEVGGAGYVISTVDDYAKWMRSWLTSSIPIDSELRQQLWTPRNIDFEQIVGPFDSDKLYCLGWWKSLAYSKDVFFHSGGVLGAGALIVLIPDITWGVTFFSNSADCANTLGSIVWYLIEQRLDIHEDERLKNFELRNQQVIEGYASIKKEFLHSRERLFPDEPSMPLIPPALPLEQYTGHYKHPGYGNINLELGHDDVGPFLLCRLTDRTWPLTVHIRHVNAEHWFCTVQFSKSPPRIGTKAETEVGANGRIKCIRLGLGIEGELLYFTKV